MTLPDQLAQFIAQFRSLQSLNFPYIASTLTPPANWFHDIKPHLRSNVAFLSAMQEVLEEIKFTLLQKLLQVGRDGKKYQGPSPEPTHIKAIIQMIDSGALLGIASKGGSSEGSVSPAEEAQRLRRMGYSEEEIERITTSS
jgi:hypothetical protein